MSTISIFKVLFLFLISGFAFASNLEHTLPTIKFNVSDKKSLQRGSKVYMENCLGCHSLKYVRFKSLAEGIGIVNTEKEVLSDYIRKNWTFNVTNMNNNVLSNMKSEDAVKWFGKTPPDLSLVTRYRGPNWVYAYMNSFYYDSAKIWNVNNSIFPDVGMPHVLISQQGAQKAIYNKTGHISELVLMGDGTMSTAGYKSMLYDLVNFLTYVGEPTKELRIRIGCYVLPFLFVFTLFSYYLYKDYWKNIKK